jgi:hypothetical protein
MKKYIILYLNKYSNCRITISSSVSIVSDYRLDDWATGVQSPAEAKNFPFSLCVQTSSEAHRASNPMGIGDPIPGVKHGQGMMLTTHPNLVPRSRLSRSYTPLPLVACMAVAGQFLFT